MRITEHKGRKKPHRVTWWADGRRKTLHFKTKGEASRFAREQGLEVEFSDLRVSPEERMAIIRIRQAAAEVGISIDEAASLAVEACRGRRRVDRPIELAVREFMADCRKRNLRPATLDHYEGMLRRFSEGRPRESVDGITRDAVRSWILFRYHGEDSRATARTPVMVWLRWCGRKGYTDPERWRDPITWDAALGDSRPIGILRPGQLRVLLGRLPPHYRFPLMLCCLTGIRPKGELTRLRWEHFDLRRKVIEIPGEADKIRRGRTLTDLPPTLWEWVAWEKKRLGRGHAGGKILPRTYRNYREAIRQAMQGQREAPSKRGRPAREEIPPIGEWPHDATRHSFASYGYHVLGIERTVELMGHVGGYGLFARRYKASARGWTARLWFAVRPR